MELIRREMGLPVSDYRTDARLMEVHFGDWQGFTYAELEAAPARFDRGPPRATNGASSAPGEGGESYQMLLDRVKPWYDALQQPTVCVTHGGVMRILFRLVDGMPEADAADMDIVQDRVLQAQGLQAGVAVAGPANAQAKTRRPLRLLLRQFHVGDHVLVADLVVGDQRMHAFLDGIDVELAGQLVGFAVLQRDGQIVRVDGG